MSEGDVVGLLIEAVNFAAIKHKDQRRKDSDKTPYINHPIGVAYSIWKEGGVTDPVVLQVQFWMLLPKQSLGSPVVIKSCSLGIPGTHTTNLNPS